MDCHFDYLRCPDVPEVEYLEATELPRWRWYLTRSVWILPITWQGEVECHQQRHALGPGRLLCADPGDVCRAVHLTRPGKLCALFIDSPGLWEASARAPRSSPLECLATLSQSIRCGAPASVLRAQLLRLIASAAGPCPELVRCARAPHPSTRIARLRDWIHSDGRHQQSVTSLAERLGVTRFQALRIFKQHFGLSPSVYQMCLRIAGAREALRDGATPAQVAADYGFSDQSHFGRRFKREVGVSPGQYADMERAARSSRQRRSDEALQQRPLPRIATARSPHLTGVRESLLGGTTRDCRSGITPARGTHGGLRSK